MKTLGALIWKDCLINWKQFAATVAGSTIFLAILFRLHPSRNDSSAVGLIFNFSFLLNVAYSEWLVVREKSKGTLSWLRSMPISTSQIVGSKFLQQAAMVFIVFGLNLLLFAPHAFRQAGGLLAQITILVLFGEALLVARMIFDSKIAMLVVLFSALLLVFGYLYLADSYPVKTALLLSMFEEPVGAWIAGLIALSTCILLLSVSSKWLAAKDVVELTD